VVPLVSGDIADIIKKIRDLGGKTRSTHNGYAYESCPCVQVEWPSMAASRQFEKWYNAKAFVKVDGKTQLFVVSEGAPQPLTEIAANMFTKNMANRHSKMKKVGQRNAMSADWEGKKNAKKNPIDYMGENAKLAVSLGKKLSLSEVKQVRAEIQRGISRAVRENDADARNAYVQLLQRVKRFEISESNDAATLLRRVLAACKSSCTMEDIATACKCDAENAEAAVDALVDAGLLTKSGSGYMAAEGEIPEHKVLVAMLRESSIAWKYWLTIAKLTPPPLASGSPPAAMS
jgi:hypothetical protein